MEEGLEKIWGGGGPGAIRWELGVKGGGAWRNVWEVTMGTEGGHLEKWGRNPVVMGWEKGGWSLEKWVLGMELVYWGKGTERNNGRRKWKKEGGSKVEKWGWERGGGAWELVWGMHLWDDKKKRLPNNASNAKEQATGATKKGGEKQWKLRCYVYISPRPSIMLPDAELGELVLRQGKAHCVTWG